MLFTFPKFISLGKWWNEAKPRAMLVVCLCRSWTRLIHRNDIDRERGREREWKRNFRCGGKSIQLFVLKSLIEASVRSTAETSNFTSEVFYKLYKWYFIQQFIPKSTVCLKLFRNVFSPWPWIGPTAHGDRTVTTGVAWRARWKRRVRSFGMAEGGFCYGNRRGKYDDGSGINTYTKHGLWGNLIAKTTITRKVQGMGLTLAIPPATDSVWITLYVCYACRWFYLFLFYFVFCCVSSLQINGFPYPLCKKDKILEKSPCTFILVL